MADPDGMFSARQSTVVTSTFRPSLAMASVAASTVAAPAMSYFIPTMPSAGFSESPPVSKVIPLPARPMCLPPPLYSIFTSRGGLTEPRPTPRIPPQFSFSSLCSSQISMVRGNPSAKLFALSATT